MHTLSTDIEILRKEKKERTMAESYMSIGDYKFYNLENAIVEFDEEHLNSLVRLCTIYAEENTAHEELYLLLNEDFGFAYFDKERAFHFGKSLTAIHRANKDIMDDVHQYIRILSFVANQKSIIDYDSDVMNRFESFFDITRDGIYDEKMPTRICVDRVLRFIASKYETPIQDYSKFFK